MDGRNNDQFVYCACWYISSIQQRLDNLICKHFSCIWPLLKPWHCSLEVLISLFVSFLFHSVTHTHTCTHARTYAHTTSEEEVGVILPCRPSGWICLRVHRDFLICVTNTNAFKFPTELLLTSLIPCNALFTSSLASPLPHPRLSSHQGRDSRTRLCWQKIHTALTFLLQVGN